MKKSKAVRAVSLAGVTLAGATGMTIGEALLGATPAGASATTCATAKTTLHLCEIITGTGQDITADYGQITNTGLTTGAVGGHLDFTGPSISGQLNTSPDIWWYSTSDGCPNGSPPTYDSRYWTTYSSCQDWPQASNNVNYTNPIATPGNYMRMSRPAWIFV